MGRLIHRYFRNTIYRLKFESQSSWTVYNFKSVEILVFTIFAIYRRGYQLVLVALVSIVPFLPHLWHTTIDCGGVVFLEEDADQDGFEWVVFLLCATSKVPRYTQRPSDTRRFCSYCTVLWHVPDLASFTDL